ncbi:unnamed protein product [Diamesa hyperborea]
MYFSVLIVILYVIYWIIQNWKLIKLDIREPIEYPMGIRQTFSVYKLKRFKFITEHCLMYPEILKVWFGPKMLLLIHKPELIQKVLMSSSCLEKWNFFYGLMERDYGLIAAKFITWRDHRKFFNYSFNLKVLRSFIPTFLEHSDWMCKDLVEETQDFDFLPYCKKISFDILCSTSLGTDMKDFSQQPLYSKILEAFEITEEAMNEKFRLPFLYPKTIFKLTNTFKKERKNQRILEEFQNDIIERRRKVIQTMQSNNTINGDTRNILIDHIILNEEKFTSEQIKDHILTFVSGYETWANGLAHTILLLAMHPEVQDKCIDEINRVFTSDDIELNYESFNELQYFDLVQKESFRLLPTVPMVLRQTVEDFEIQPGVVIPKDVNVLINFFALHRQPEIWGENADKFDPDNFLPENAAKRHPFSFLPFSAGQRNCIAYRYSMLSLKITVVKLLQAFKFSTSMQMKDLRFKSYISLKLCTPHLLRIEKRSKTS